MRILFIEDEEDLSALGAEQLRSMGHEVFEAPDLETARIYLNDPTLKFHLIIADHRLPDGFGIDFLIHQTKVSPQIPSVIVSGCLTAADAALLTRMGIPYFRKPVLYSHVVRKLRQAPPVDGDSKSYDGDYADDDERESGSTGWLRGIFDRFRRD
ncbi:MAG: response regulator [Opitutales bacterium]|nr:response regulator [Opitutales bacterium]